MTQAIDSETGRQALRALLRERSLLGPLEVLYARVGRWFQVPLPSFHPYITGGPEANRKLLVTDSNKLLWRNPDPVTEVLRRGVLVTDGEEHDHDRSLMEPDLHPSVLVHYMGTMLAQTERVTSTWQDGEVVDMLVEGRKIALLIVMQTLFGVDAWGDLPTIWEPLLKTIEYISPGPWILWRRFPRVGFKRHRQVLDDYLYHIIRSRRDSRGHMDLLQHLLDARLDDDRIRDQMLTMLIAGHDTSTALLAWAFYLLGLHPDILADLTQQLDQALGKQPPPAVPGWQPPLLDHVIKETLRLYPPIHIGSRVVGQAVDFGGHAAAPGERILYSIYLTHRDPEYWENAETFCPDRFASGRKTPPFAYVPFGGGTRACIGAAFGQAEARLVLARLLQTYSFELVDASVRAHMGATLEPRPGVFLRVRKRRELQP
ncbi:MAG TPA: cytochrome P450 [Anaerolineales bacterium]